MNALLALLQSIVKRGSRFGVIHSAGGAFSGRVVRHAEDTPLPQSARTVGFLEAGRGFSAQYVTTHGDSGRLYDPKKDVE